MEERRKLRHREIEAASRLSVLGENLFPSPAILSRGVVDRFLRRSGSRVSILMACRREVPTGHLASVLSLYPLGQPEKALGHEPQIDLCVAPRQPPGLPASQIDRRRRYSIKMQLRWNHARLAAGPEERKPKRNGSHNEQGLEVKNALSPSGRGRKMSLTSPLIDQGISLKILLRAGTSEPARGRHGYLISLN
jgi:hypothetical protein